MNKIVLVTTKGCEGCNIMHKSIKQALDCTSKKIEYVVKDVTELTKEEKSKLKTYDFPTTLFYKNDRITRQEVGTRPYIVVVRWIDVDFK